MNRFCRIACVTFALAAGAANAGSAQAGSVRGIVRDEGTLAPISGAVVTVLVAQPDSSALWAQTDAQGRYEILNIPSGYEHYVVNAAAAQHTWSYASFTDLGSTNLTYDILLPVAPSPPPPGNPDSTFLSGTVLAGSNGTLVPIAGASVFLSSGAGTFGLVTGATGRYSVMVPSGVYSVAVSAGGYQTLNLSDIKVEGTSLVYNAGLHSTVDAPAGLDGGFVLFGAVPHPLRSNGSVSFGLPVASQVSLRLYDAAGRLRATLLEGVQPEGQRSVPLRTDGLASGVYMVRMEATPVDGGSSFTAGRRVVVLR